MPTAPATATAARMGFEIAMCVLGSDSAPLDCDQIGGMAVYTFSSLMLVVLILLPGWFYFIAYKARERVTEGADRTIAMTSDNYKGYMDTASSKHFNVAETKDRVIPEDEGWKRLPLLPLRYIQKRLWWLGLVEFGPVTLKPSTTDDDSGRSILFDSDIACFATNNIWFTTSSTNAVLGNLNLSR